MEHWGGNIAGVQVATLGSWDVSIVSDTLPGNSHPQDFYIFSRGSRPKPSFATMLLLLEPNLLQHII